MIINFDKFNERKNLSKNYIFQELSIRLNWFGRLKDSYEKICICIAIIYGKFNKC